MEKIFNAGDKVWVKNLVTNEAHETMVTNVNHMVFDDGSSCYLYTTTDGPHVNIPGDRTNPNSVFATREECEASARYYPKTGPIYIGNYTDKDWVELDRMRQ